MFDTTIFCFAFILFFITHGIADYWLQTDKQAQYKSQQGWFGPALWSHIIVYQFSFLPAFFILGRVYPGLPLWQVLLASASIGGLHILMDQRGFLYWFCATTKGWQKGGADLNEPFNGKEVTVETIFTLSSIAAVRQIVGIEMDQRYHMFCLGLTAALLAWR